MWCRCRGVISNTLFDLRVLHLPQMAALKKCAKFLLNSVGTNRGFCVTYAANQITSNERSLKTNDRTRNAARGSSPSYCKMIQQRREEAERSISVCFPPATKVSNILRDIEEIAGPVKNALYYRLQNESRQDQNNILIELEDLTAVKKLLHDRIDLYRVLRYHPQDGKTEFRGPFPKNVQKDELRNEEFDVNILNTAVTLSEQISTLHFHLKMRPTQTRLKFFTCQRIEEMIRWIYPGTMVLPFGSGATGLGLVDGSDLDMNLIIDDEKQDSLSPSLSCLNEPPMSRARLQKAGKLLEVSTQFRHHTYILNARVPIIKFKDCCTGFECDLSCGSRSALTMSQIQYLMSEYDERFHPLITVLRVWSRAFEVKKSSPGPWLSNFMLQMLIVHFLQTRNPPVLPPIKDLYRSDVDDEMIDRLSTSLEESFLKDIYELPVSANKQSTGELLLEFFRYYGDFSYADRKIDILNGTLEGRSDERSSIWVKNPYDKGNNICKNVRRQYVLKFRYECKRAALRLQAYATKINAPWGLSYVINPALTMKNDNRNRPSTDKPNKQQRPSTDKPNEQRRPSADKPNEQQRPSTDKPNEQQRPSTDKPNEQQRPSTDKPNEQQRPSTDKPNEQGRTSAR